MEHQSLNVNSSDCWRERVKAETGTKKLASDTLLRSIQKKGDNRRMAATLLPRRTSDMVPAYRCGLLCACDCVCVLLRVLAGRSR